MGSDDDAVDAGHRQFQVDDFVVLQGEIVSHVEKVFAQCNGLAIHALVKSPDTGRTGSILIEVFEYVRLYEHEIYRNIID